MTKFVGLKSKMIKRIIKRKLKLEDYKNFLEIKWFQNKINYLGNNEIDLDSLKEFFGLVVYEFKTGGWL